MRRCGCARVYKLESPGSLLLSQYEMHSAQKLIAIFFNIVRTLRAVPSNGSGSRRIFSFILVSDVLSRGHRQQV